MTEKQQPNLDDDAMAFAIRFVLGIAAVVALSVTTAIVVGVIALVRWVF